MSGRLGSGKEAWGRAFHCKVSVSAEAFKFNLGRERNWLHAVVGAVYSRGANKMGASLYMVSLLFVFIEGVVNALLTLKSLLVCLVGSIFFFEKISLQRDPICTCPSLMKPESELGLLTTSAAVATMAILTAACLEQINLFFIKLASLKIPLSMKLVLLYPLSHGKL